MVEGGSDQAHRAGHVREDLVPKKLDGTDGAASQLVPSHRLVCRGYGARWTVRLAVSVLEVTFAVSRPSNVSVDALSDNLQVNQKVVTDQTGISSKCRSRGLQAPETKLKPLKTLPFQRSFMCRF